MLEIEVHGEASTEAEEAADWYEQRREGLGFDFLWELADAYHKLQEGILSGMPWPDDALAKRGVKRIFLKRFPFQVVFIERSGQVIVLAVAHFSRRPAYWRGRLTGAISQSG